MKKIIKSIFIITLLVSLTIPVQARYHNCSRYPQQWMYVTQGQGQEMHTFDYTDYLTGTTTEYPCYITGTYVYGKYVCTECNSTTRTTKWLQGSGNHTNSKCPNH